MGNIRVPVYIVCAALVVAAKSDEATNYFGRRLEPIDVTPDQETVSYLLPRLAAKYRPNSEWSGVTDPRFYVLTEMDTNNIDGEKLHEGRSKRTGGPSLSIVNNLDVLRNRLLYELERKRLIEQVKANRQLLNSLGNEGLEEGKRRDYK